MHIHGQRDGTVAERLNLPTIRRIPVVLPPLHEQVAIAGVLGPLDDKIELNRQISQTLEAMARALFKSWLVDFDPVREGQPWARTLGKVGDLAKLSREAIVPIDFPDEIFAHYSIPAFDEGRVAKSEKGADIKSNKFVVPLGAVLLSKLNPRIPRVWMPTVSNQIRSICSTEFLVVLPREADSDRDFLYSLFCSPEFLEQFASRATGTSGSHQRVKPEDFLQMVLEVPEATAREQYSHIVRPLFDKVALNLEESQSLAAIRDALLPKLLSGEIRVQQAERIAGEVV